MNDTCSGTGPVFKVYTLSEQAGVSMPALRHYDLVRLWANVPAYLYARHRAVAPGPPQLWAGSPGAAAEVVGHWGGEPWRIWEVRWRW